MNHIQKRFSKTCSAGLASCKLMALLGMCLLLGGCRVMSQTQNGQGTRAYQQGNYQVALQHFQQATRSDPRNPDGYYNLAAVYHQLGKTASRPGDFELAESYYNQCLDLSPDHEDCHRGLATMLVDQGRKDEAFRLLEGWTARSPALPEAKLELARLHHEQGNRDAAKQQLLAAATVSPNNAKVLAALGKVREELGETDQALASYQRSLAMNRFQPQVAARVAALQSRTGPASTRGDLSSGGKRIVNGPNTPQWR